ncbi:MAG: flagellar motor switch protein FliN [Pseudomonadales bacterium]|nr:flagellar motor switch protein FliN [Pseudomonadales bacterium]
MSDEDDIINDALGEDAGQENAAVDGLKDGSEDEEDPWAAAMEEQDEFENAATPELEELVDEAAPPSTFDGENPDLEVILDIPVSISMVVGNTPISIRNLLQLNQGSVIELDRMAGEPLDVLVNNTLIAHGEVVVVNEKFGIRLTDVISAAERIRGLG